jgi:two-component system sensor histidine kinase YesM
MRIGSILESMYFRKMFVCLLLASLLPITMLGGAFIVLYGGWLDNSVQESAGSQTEQVAREVDRFISESTQLGQSCAEQMTVKSVLSYLPGKLEINELTLIIQLMVTGKEDRLALHVVNATKSFSSGTVPPQYAYSQFSQQDFFQSLDSTPHTSILFAQPYTDDAGRLVVLSVVTPAYDYYNQFVGYTIVDMYQSALLKICSAFGSQLETAIWYDDTLLLNTADNGLPGIQAIRGMAGYMPDDTGGMSHQKNTLFLWRSSTNKNIMKVFSYDTADIHRIKQNATIIFVVLFVISALLSLGLALALSVRQSRPIVKLYRAMDNVGKGDLSVQAEVIGRDEISDLSRRFNLLVQQLDQNIQERFARDEQLRLQQISALQAQINPHFLYNSLGAIKSLARMNRVAEVSEIVIHLSALLHGNLQEPDRLITLKEDIRLITSYITIQNIRFTNRFSLETDIPAKLRSCLLPALLLQPIVENAIEHGLEQKPGNGTVHISARRSEGDVILVIRDDGLGITREMEHKLNSSDPVSTHIGYLNVRRRIELFYGDGYSARIRCLKQGTEVTLKIKYGVRKEELDVPDPDRGG